MGAGGVGVGVDGLGVGAGGVGVWASRADERHMARDSIIPVRVSERRDSKGGLLRKPGSSAAEMI